MGISMKECLNKGKDQDKERIILLKDSYIKGNGIMVKYKALVYVNGLMESIIRVIGWITKKVGKG